MNDTPKANAGDEDGDEDHAVDDEAASPATNQPVQWHRL